MFNKELKKRIEVLELANENQDKINKQLITVLESQDKIEKNFAERIVVLEKKLAEGTTDKPESLEDKLDINGGAISDVAM